MNLFVAKFYLVSLLLASINSCTKIDRGTVIGIDLGTTYSCVAVVRNGRVEIIPNEYGSRITPSYVSFRNHSEILVGDAAKNQATSNPTNTIFDTKRLIGRLFNDSSVQADMKLWPFKIVNNKNKPYIQIIDSKGKKKNFAPEEISALVLSWRI